MKIVCSSICAMLIDEQENRVKLYTLPIWFFAQIVELQILLNKTYRSILLYILICFCFCFDIYVFAKSKQINKFTKKKSKIFNTSSLANFDHAYTQTKTTHTHTHRRHTHAHI